MNTNSSNRFLYYLTGGYWFVGHKLNHHRGYFAHIGDQECPEMLDQVNERWFYFRDKKWEDKDPSLSIKCV